MGILEGFPIYTRRQRILDKLVLCGEPGDDEGAERGLFSENRGSERLVKFNGERSSAGGEAGGVDEGEDGEGGLGDGSFCLISEDGDEFALPHYNFTMLFKTCFSMLLA